MKTVKLVQGSSEWHAHRKLYRNASETPIIMGVSPWQTPYQLWEIKTGRREVDVNEAMRHGTEMEPFARSAFEAKAGLIMQPQVVVDELYSASLDGITLDGNTILEIKCPFKGQASELWQTMKGGRIPEHYRLQVQHQLMVSKAEIAYLWVFDGTAGIKTVIKSDEACHLQIRQAWDQYWVYLDRDLPPPLSDQDTVIRTDLAWEAAAHAYIQAKAELDKAQETVEAAKSQLIGLARHTRESGCGVNVTRYWKQGNINYKEIPQLQGLDLELYRFGMREETRITLN